MLEINHYSDWSGGNSKESESERFYTLSNFGTFRPDTFLFDETVSSFQVEPITTLFNLAHKWVPTLSNFDTYPYFSSNSFVEGFFLLRLSITHIVSAEGHHAETSRKYFLGFFRKDVAVFIKNRNKNWPNIFLYGFFHIHGHSLNI